MHVYNHHWQPQEKARNDTKGYRTVSCSVPQPGNQQYKLPNLTHVGIYVTSDLPAETCLANTLVCYSTRL